MHPPPLLFFLSAIFFYSLPLSLLQDVEIDIELAPGDQTAIPKNKEQAEKDTGNQLHMLTNRHDKFLDSLREVKVSYDTNICPFSSNQPSPPSLTSSCF